MTDADTDRQVASTGTLTASMKGLRQLRKEVPSCPRVAVMRVTSMPPGLTPTPVKLYSHSPTASLYRLTEPSSTVPAVRGLALSHRTDEDLPSQVSGQMPETAKEDQSGPMPASPALVNKFCPSARTDFRFDLPAGSLICTSSIKTATNSPCDSRTPER